MEYTKTHSLDRENFLWRADVKRYSSLKRSSYELNLMLTQCQRILDKGETELFGLLGDIKTANTNYLGFVDKYLLEQSNYRLINQVTKPAQREKGLTTYLRSLDREGIFAETFDQIVTMKNKIINFGTITEPEISTAGTIQLSEYEEFYTPLFNSVENMRAYFAPTKIDTVKDILETL